ncbi:NUDIX hydrolase [Streptomyces parvus]|uniref:NUDIX hydrolase n=1 Tax=Streptomyces parvus TaxID=66428 RepID=A0A5D4JJ07_9ACTN|nr:NUDIX hydrolase [Streptomyces parvus]
MTHHVECVAILEPAAEEGRVLMVRHRVSEEQLSWQFPAGELKPGEAREDTAVRETQEETGLDVAAVRTSPRASLIFNPLRCASGPYVGCW